MQIHATIFDHPLTFATDGNCFSPKAVDAGTLAMLNRCTLTKGQKIHDLGCGYGAVGIACAKVAGDENVYMSDITSLTLARENAIANSVPHVNIVQSDGYKTFDETGFDLILCNPPYHADFGVPKHFIEKGFNRLNIGGRMFFVVKRLEWYKRKFIAIFGGVKVYREDGGYFVLEGVKESSRYAVYVRGIK